MLRTKLAPALATVVLLPMSALPSACMIQDQSGGKVMAEPNQQKTTQGNTSLVQISEELLGEVDGAVFRISASLGGLRVTAAGDALFAPNSTTLLSAARRDLEIIARKLAAGPGGILNITGHTDDRGSATDNQLLSEQQAAIVAEIFRATGSPHQFVQPHGLGETTPVASNQTSAGRAQNRRVEIIFQANIH